jgi:hypothetical protein
MVLFLVPCLPTAEAPIELDVNSIRQVRTSGPWNATPTPTSKCCTQAFFAGGGRDYLLGGYDFIFLFPLSFLVVGPLGSHFEFPKNGFWNALLGVSLEAFLHIWVSVSSLR